MTEIEEFHLYTGPKVFFHGGAPGLRVGGWILPPTTTGVATSEAYATYPPGVYRNDMVYLVTEVEQAKAFAGLCRVASVGRGARARGGDVYRVVPALLVAMDPGCQTDGLSWCAPAAKIVSIVATSVRRGPYERELIGSTRAGEEVNAGRWTRRTFNPSK